MQAKLLVIIGLLHVLFLVVAGLRNEDCSNFNDQNACQGSQTDTPADWAGRVFQTPPNTGEPTWQPSYQFMNLLVGYAQLLYSGDRMQAQVVIQSRVNERRLGTRDYSLVYMFGNKTQSRNTYTATAEADTVLPVKIFLTVEGKNVASLELDPVDFIWNHPKVNQPPNFAQGQKGAIVEMFGWTYDQIEKECPALGKMGWLGVKVFPPQEAILDFNKPENGELNPWYWVYQPVSYRQHSRAGTQDQLRKMINTCRASGVRVYADAVINHMSGNGNDQFPKHRVNSGGYCNRWGAKNSSAGSPYYTQGYAYENISWTGERPGNEFPSVPYGPLDFHCERPIRSWTSPFDLNYGWLVGLCDLNTEAEYVRQRIADYLTELLSLGFSGVRIDAAKHIFPDSLAAIFARLKKNLGGGDLPVDFIAYLEVIIGGEKDLLMCTINNYNFGKYFEDALGKAGLSPSDVFKIKIWSSDYPKEFPICGYWVIDSRRLAIENECHDDQFPGSSSRDMGDKGSILVKEKDIGKHRHFEKELFSRTDGNWAIRLVLSSYTFRESVGAFAPPDGNSDCNKCRTEECKKLCTKTVPFSAAHDPNVCGYTLQGSNGQWLEGVFTRVHRDMSIIIAMRRWMGLSTDVSAEQLGLPSHCRQDSPN